MKKWLMQVLGCLMIITSVMAEPLVNMKKWAEAQPEGKVRKELSRLGVPDEDVQNRIISGWEELTVVDAALQFDAIGLLMPVVVRDGLKDESVERILQHELQKPQPSPAIWRIFLTLSPNQQKGFAPVLEKCIPTRYKDMPVLAKMARKYVIGMGRPEITIETETQDLVALLLAPEIMNFQQMNALKRVLKDQSVRLAKRKLRAEGGTFVVQDGVNPLLQRVQPVIDALNGPMALGLEEALRELGADVEDQDRTELQRMVEGWQKNIMLGEIYDTKWILGRLAVGLGVDGFNSFVDAYNNGEDAFDEAP